MKLPAHQNPIFDDFYHYLHLSTFPHIQTQFPLPMINTTSPLSINSLSAPIYTNLSKHYNILSNLPRSKTTDHSLDIQNIQININKRFAHSNLLFTSVCASAFPQASDFASIRLRQPIQDTSPRELYLILKSSILQFERPLIRQDLLRSRLRINLFLQQHRLNMAIPGIFLFWQRYYPIRPRSIQNEVPLSFSDTPDPSAFPRSPRIN